MRKDISQAFELQKRWNNPTYELGSQVGFVVLRSGLLSDMSALEFHVQRQHLPLFLGDGVKLFFQLFFQILMPGDAQQSGTCTAQAERCTRGSNQCFDFLIIGDQLFPVVLVELILHGVAQELFVSQLQGFQDQGAVGDVVNGISPAHLLRQDASCL